MYNQPNGMQPEGMSATQRPREDIFQRNLTIAERLENLAIDMSNRLHDISKLAPPSAQKCQKNRNRNSVLPEEPTTRPC